MPVFGAWAWGPFFTGAATAPSDIVPAQYPVAIHGHPYNVEWRDYKIVHLPTQREARSDEAEPGESMLNPAGLWRRSQSDWSLGAGQLWLDEEESTRRRFRTSLGVDVLNDRKMSLLPSTEEKRDIAGATNPQLLVAGARLYAIDGTNVRFSDATSSEQNATWVTNWTAATGLPGGNQLSMAYSGSHVYVLGSDNSIYRATPGTAAFGAAWYNPTAVLTKIWFAIGRLFGSDGRNLYEITATPGETLIFTHPSPNYVISHVCGAPTGIYISGAVGTDYGEIRHSWVDDTGTAFVPPIVVAEFDNEAVNVTATIGGNMVIGTMLGLRYAPIDSVSSGLSFGPAIELGPVYDITIESVIGPDGNLDTFAWATWTNIEGLGPSGLAKVRLTRFTEPLVPAYASDVYSANGGTVLAVASIRGRRYFSVSGDGHYGASGNLVASGTLSTGRIRYGILDDKVFSDLKWHTAPLLGSISAEALFDDGTVVSAGAQTVLASTTNEHSQIGPTRGEWAEITFTLTRDAGDATDGPELFWWVMRAIPAAEASLRYIVPLRLYLNEQTPLGPYKGVDFAGEVDFLHNLLDSKAIVRYQVGQLAHSVYLNNLEFSSSRWNASEHAPEGIVTVELISVTN